jgi:Uma2 family endonuclease
MVAVARPLPAGEKLALTLLTVEEYFALPEGPPDYELEEGILIEMPRPSPRHQAILRELLAEMTLFLRSTPIGTVWPEVDVQLSRSRVVVPDLVFLATENRERLRHPEGHIVGAPDLMVEILSPASASRDRVAKFNAYRQAGVPWYGLVDGESLVVEEFQLTPQGYLAVARVAAGSAFQPQVFPGLTINLVGLLGEPGEA